MSLGDLQHLTMLAVLRLGEGAFSAAIREELLRVAGRDVAVSTVHVTLLRLEERGLVTSEKGTRQASGPGRPRRVFSVTMEGREALQESWDAYHRMWAEVNIT